MRFAVYAVFIAAVCVTAAIYSTSIWAYFILVAASVIMCGAIHIWTTFDEDTSTAVTPVRTSSSYLTPTVAVSFSPSAEIEQSVSQAARRRSNAAASRKAIERHIDDVIKLRRALLSDIKFTSLASAHNKSRLLADAWYVHKRDALLSLHVMERAARHLETTQLSNFEVQVSKESIQLLKTSITALRQEVKRGRSSLIAQNKETALLRDRIRDDCGKRGRDWFNRLEARKAAKELD